MTRKELDEIPMVFIVGKGRSGTTLLQTILDAHPDCIIPLESRLIIHLKSRYRHVKKWTPGLIKSFYNDLFSDLKFSTLWKVDKDKLLSDLLSLGTDADFASLCKVVYLNYKSVFKKDKIRLIGDKNPIYTVFIPELLEIFPGSKFIHLIRDHRDNIHSHMKVFPIKNVAFLASKWVFFNERVEHQKRLNPGTVLSLRYEDLVANPQKHLKEICEFLGLSYHPGMLDFHERMNDGFSYIEPFVKKFHANIYNPVNISKVDEWKKGMNEKDVVTADMIAGRKALEYGYHVGKRINMLQSERSYTSFKLFIWLRFIKAYYNMPLPVREAATGVFKMIFGKDYKKKKELFTSDKDDKG